MTSPLLQAAGLVRRVRTNDASPFSRARDRTVLAGVDIAAHPGEVLGLIGRSGSGKTTLARILMGLAAPDEGRVLLNGRDLYHASAAIKRRLRPQLQGIFQDPHGALDPRQRVADILAEQLLPLKLSRAERGVRIEQALAEVALPSSAAARFPHQFSGGQRQRIAIARALITRPRLLIADEPVSALDVPVQAQVLNLLLDLRERHGLTIVFISHDMAVIRHIADRIAVLDSGAIVEEGPAAQLIASPQHESTKALLPTLPIELSRIS